MANYLVLIDEKNSDKVITRLKENYDDIYEYHQQQRIFFVRTSDISEKIATKIGIINENKIEGASGGIYRMSNYSAGFTNGNVWKWLTNGEDK